jgi:hypothetical protein
MLFESLLFGLAAGVLLGGSIKAIFNASFKRLHFIFMAAALDIAMSTSLGGVIAGLGSWAPIAATALQALLLLLFVLSNLTQPALWLIGLGGIMNSAAIAFNSGRMPISPQILEIAPNSPYTLSLLQGEIFNYALAVPSTKLLFLSDIITFRGLTLYMISAGDMVTSAGLIILIISLMLPEGRSSSKAGA